MGYKDSEKQSAYQAEWLRRRRDAWFAEHGPCVNCGSTDRLELDHIDPFAKISHSVWSWRKDRRDAELAKCQVLCHECHAAKSAAELPYAGFRWNHPAAISARNATDSATVGTSEQPATGA